MLRKDLARYEPELIDQWQEWKSFLGLLGVLALEPVERPLYESCRGAIGRRSGGTTGIGCGRDSRS
jgi:hypothetical protein